MTQRPTPAPPNIAEGAATAASARFAATALAHDAVDVTYATLDTPVGRLVAVRTRAGLAMLSYEDHRGGLDAILDVAAARLSPRVLEAPAALDDVRRQLEQYFAGDRTTFALDLDLRLASPYTQRVMRATIAVPFGTTVTYATIATALGNPKASRAAGRALGANPIPIVVPCHRIVGSSGRLTGYTGGMHRKVALLELEGLVLG